MLNFELLTVPALKSLLPYIRVCSSHCSDFSAGYLFMWYIRGNAQYCLCNETFVIMHKIGEQPAFSYPVGADVSGMIDKIIEYVHQNHLPLRFFAVDDETIELIRNDERLQPAMWAYDRKWSDYIYSFEDAMNFKGRRFSGQRNHINRFKKLYGEPVIRFLTDKDRPGIENVMKEYEAEHKFCSKIERLELERTYKLLELCDDLGLYCAGLFIDGELAAFSVGEIVKETLLIHVEKAIKRYEGIYPTMYSGFVRLISEYLQSPQPPQSSPPQQSLPQSPQPQQSLPQYYTLRFVNREDDSGDPGLRTSKTQYHPIRMANKYLVHVGSPAAKMKKVFEITSGGGVLTEIRESDRQAYLKLNIDVENNRYWGYDYRDDYSITGPVDEDTFFEPLIIDMRAGDSINFAIRLSSDGEMIGEAILWNFTSDNTAELGCRLFPEYHGKGYGKAAFGAAAGFAADNLKVKVVAKCYRENTASYHMITACGFTQVREDEEFYYFGNQDCEII